MIFVGACEEFFKRGHTFDRLLGTSSGAVTTTVLAAGNAPDEALTSYNALRCRAVRKGVSRLERLVGIARATATVHGLGQPRLRSDPHLAPPQNPVAAFSKLSRIDNTCGLVDVVFQ